MSEENKDTLHDEAHEEEHNFDGITEHNNPAPTWIIILFLVTIGFSGLYAIHYFGHPNMDNDQTSEYNRKVAEFEIEKLAMREANKAEGGELSQADILAEGRSLYAEKGCIACHGTMGEGNNIGPNLSDNAWLNGCSPEELIDVIANGRPTKGMTPYKTMMTEDQIAHVTSYILEELVGSNPANGKEAQGEVCE